MLPIQGLQPKEKYIMTISLEEIMMIFDFSFLVRRQKGSDDEIENSNKNLCVHPRWPLAVCKHSKY